MRVCRAINRHLQRLRSPYGYGAPSVLPISSATNSYQANLNHSWKIHANGNIAALELQTSVFNVPAPDFVSFSGQNFQGLFAPGTSFWKNVAGVIESGVNMQFVSDGNASTVEQFNFDLARVWCGSPSPPVTPTLTQSLRHEGLLLGTGDTLFFQVVGGADDIFIWTSTSSGADIDLYVRTGAPPTKNTYTQRSVGTSGNEAVRIQGSSAGQVHYVAVTSFSGAGSFALRFSRAKATEIRHQRIGTSFSATPAQLATIRSMVQANMLKFFGATEGQIVVASAAVSNMPNGLGGCTCAGGACDVCITNTVGVAYCFGHVTLFSAEWDGSAGDDDDTLAHEWGHCILGFLDEYNNHNGVGACAAHPDELCGHTVMARLETNNLCGPLGHKKNTFPTGHVCASCSTNGTCSNSCNSCQFNFGDNWSALQGRVNLVETLTPDNQDYFGHQGLSALLTVN